jgi:uncharacterized membrane protein YGL010W
MKTLVEQLTNYAAYHRDRRNIATHFVGIPMISVAVAALLARVTIANLPISAALLVSLAICAYYLALELRFGLVMTALMAVNLTVGTLIAAQPFATWLAISLGLFFFGWALQFVGHYFEGRKPAFVDDLLGLLIGPLFVTAELGFALGLRHELLATIEQRVGKTRGAPLRARA